MESQPSVLIVDGSEDSREVLRTALERRGWRTFAASRSREGVEMAQRHQPDLIVVDMELDGSPAESLCDVAGRTGEDVHPPVILLGSVRPVSGQAASGQFVPKPYHYGALIRRIEELLRHAS